MLNVMLCYGTPRLYGEFISPCGLPYYFHVITLLLYYMMYCEVINRFLKNPKGSLASAHLTCHVLD